jgi:hypothetical protein
MLVNRVRQTEEFHHQPNFMRRDYLQNGVISEVSETLLQQATQESVAEIENIITDLLNIREQLHAQASRVRQELDGYLRFSETAFQSSKVICESLARGLRPYKDSGRSAKPRARKQSAARQSLRRKAGPLRQVKHVERSQNKRGQLSREARELEGGERSNSMASR